MREEELIAGVKADLAVKVFGDEIQELIRIARETADLLDDVPGAQDVSIEQIGGLPVLQATVERSMIARYGVNVSDVLDVIEAAIGGKTAGQLFQGDKRFDIVVRLPATLRGNIAELKRLTVKTASGAQIPLDQLAQIEVVTGLNQINRENASRRVAVQANIRGRDLATFVADFRQRLAEKIEPKLPPGYHIELGGQFENLQAAQKSLMIVVPVALGLIFFLLYSAFGSLRQSLLIFTGVPLAMSGGVFALIVRGIPFSISAGIGFIALSGIAVLNGVVMLTYINRLRGDGFPVEEAAIEGATGRLRPVLMTALVASLGFIPMAIATGMGAEVQRPLATVVIGGIISSTLLTLFILPILYRIFGNGSSQNGESILSEAAPLEASAKTG
jgi:cobalt-zinc-cadmium resistance protein CzcA